MLGLRCVKKSIILACIALLAFLTLGFMLQSDVYGASIPSATGKAKVSGIIVRSSYSSSSKKIKSLSKGKTFKITKEKTTSKTSSSSKYKWYYTSTYKGYIRADLVSLSYGKVSGYTTDSVNVRTGAGTSFSSKHTFAKGKSLTIVMNAVDKSKKSWYKIKYGSKYYYISAAYVKLGKSSPDNSNSGGSNNSGSTDNTVVTSDYGKSLVAAGFPASYAVRLESLHNAHPNWVFNPVQTGLDWSSATAKMTSDSGTNTIEAIYAPSYRSTDKECYNYLKNSYTPKDGSSWYAASDKAVYYYMDPRNWFDSTNIFMFEDDTYNSSYQTASVVKAVVENNSVLKANASLFVAAGAKYDINPIYLASKSYTEIGGYTYTVNGKTFKYGGVKYKKCYNAYNIGASDGSNAATRGLVYANGGKVSKNYKRGTGKSNGRAWSTLGKAINGGAYLIAKEFVGTNQDTKYLEHFNVRNGLANVGTHVYMTAVFGPKSMAYATADAYSDYGILDKTLAFYIPVYNNMPGSPCSKPSTSSKKNNNCYLKALSYKVGSAQTTLIKSSKLKYTKTFNTSVANSVASVDISATEANSGASVSGDTGIKQLSVGTNTFKIKCTASSGQSRTYTINITRSN